MQLLDNVLLLGLLGRAGEGEPSVKVLGGPKHIREQEVEECPELMQVVLERGSSDQEAILADKESHDLGQHGIFVLDAVGLVNDDVVPGKLLEERLLKEDHLIGGDAHIKFSTEEILVRQFGLRQERQESKKISNEKISNEKSRSYPFQGRTLSSLLPWKTKTFMVGHHLANSLFQFKSVDLGTTSKCGPAISFTCLR